MQPQAPDFLQLQREEDVVIAMDHMLGKAVDVKDAVGRASLLAELKCADFQAACLMEPAHGCYKLRDSVRFLLDICRMCLVHGNGAGTHNAILPLLLRPKCVPFLESFRLIEMSSRFSFTTNVTIDFPEYIDRQQLDACSKSNMPTQHNDECSRSNTESQMGEASKIKCQKVPI